MQQPAFRIYVTANLTVFFTLCVFSFPEGIGFGLVALPFSILFSIPSLILLIACFYFIRQLKPGLIGSWLLLMLTIVGAGSIPPLFFSLLDAGSGDGYVFLFSFGSAFAGMALQAFYINHYFQTIHNEAEQIKNN